MRPRFLELLRTLDHHAVEFVVVGGVAAILEGAPITTLDLDFVYRVEADNLKSTCWTRSIVRTGRMPPKRP